MKSRKNFAPDDVESVLEEVSENIFEEYAQQTQFASLLIYIITELTINAKEHAHAKEISLTLEADQQSISLTLADDGIGLRGSYIANKIVVVDDCEALKKALSGVSSKGTLERGYGISSVKRALQSLQGVYTISSGECIFSLDSGTETFARNKIAVQGVAIIIQGSVDNTLSLYEIVE